MAGELGSRRSGLLCCKVGGGTVGGGDRKQLRLRGCGFKAACISWFPFFLVNGLPSLVLWTACQVGFVENVEMCARMTNDQITVHLKKWLRGDGDEDGGRWTGGAAMDLKWFDDDPFRGRNPVIQIEGERLRLSALKRLSRKTRGRRVCLHNPGICSRSGPQSACCRPG